MEQPLGVVLYADPSPAASGHLSPRASPELLSLASTDPSVLTNLSKRGKLTRKPSTFGKSKPLGNTAHS